MSEQPETTSKRGPGRPRIYRHADAGDRRRASAAKSKERYKQRNLSLHGDIHDRFLTLRDAHSKKLKIRLTNQQFFHLLLYNWEDNNR